MVFKKILRGFDDVLNSECNYINWEESKTYGGGGGKEMIYTEFVWMLTSVIFAQGGSLV